MAIPTTIKPAQNPPEKPQPLQNDLKAEKVDVNAENEKHKAEIAQPKETDRLICGSCGKETKSREKCTECGAEFE